MCLSLERSLLCSNKLSSLGPTLPPYVCLGFASLVLKWCSSFPENLGQEQLFVQEASVRYSHRADGSSHARKLGLTLSRRLLISPGSWLNVIL